MGAAVAVAVLQNRLAGNPSHGLSGMASAAYRSSFAGAMRWTLAVPIAVLVLAGLSCLLALLVASR
jgi:hypothetical protein